MSTAPSIQRSPKPCARVGMLDANDELGASMRSLLASQPGVQVVSLPKDHDLAAKKFEGFIIDLRRDDALAMLEAIRNSGRNRRAVIFGVYEPTTEIRRYSKFGINALFHWPLKKADALKILRTATTLLTHELRRYARIPLATDVELKIEQRSYHGISRDLSGGGMSIQFQTLPKTSLEEPADLDFQIPPGKKIGLHGLVCWIYEPERLIGIQFQSEPESLKPVKAWVDDYLGIA